MKSPLIDLRRCLIARQSTAREATEEILSRIEAWQPRINAFISVEQERAMNEAGLADEALQAQRLGALTGVPLAHKDMFARGGNVVTCGSLSRANWRPPAKATVLRRLEEAGSVTLGTLNMAELAYTPTGGNNLVGPARNPWNTSYICGGSSSGSAAAVAAGLCYGSLGSDTGGSVRIPASICGVVGFMPTRGRVSRSGALPLSTSLDCIGVLAQTIRDAAELLACIAGPDAEDPTTAPMSSWDPSVVDVSQAKDLRIGLMQGYFTSNLSNQHGLALENAIATMSGCGLRLTDVDPGDMDAVVSAANVLLGAESAAVHLQAIAKERDKFSESIRTRIENGFAYSAIDYISALKFRPVALERFLKTTDKYDVLVSVTYGQPTPTIDQIEGRPPEETTAMVSALSHWTRPINFLGLPAASVPMGITSDGMPAGLQIIAKPFREDHVVALAETFERARGEFSLSPSLPSHGCTSERIFARRRKPERRVPNP